MPRSIWSGSISFGLVNIPVKLFNAVSRKTVHFNQIDARTGGRVRMQRVSAADGSEVPYDQVVKGYEISPERYVLVTPDELDALDPEASRTIDIEAFVDLADIDPIYYDSPYYVAPTKPAEKPYALLVRAMEEEGKVAVARFVMRTKQYLAALRPRDGHLVLSTMVYADEVVDAADIDELRDLDQVSVSDRELAMATSLIESLTADFVPEQFRDEYRERVLELIERKAAGEEVAVAVAPAEPSRVVDLMAALEASVQAAREARGRHPSARAAAATEPAEEAAPPAEEAMEEPAAAAGGGGRAAGKKKAPAKKAPAGKTSARKASNRTRKSA